MRRAIIICGLIALMALGAGCADFRTYMRDRGNDLADCFTARAGTYYGFGVRAQVTNYIRVGVGVGVYSGEWVGWFGRDRVDEERFIDGPGWIGAPLSLLALSTELRAGDGHVLTPSILGINIGEVIADMERETLEGPRWSRTAPYLRRKYFIETGFTLGVVGFEVGFNPVEFADFLLGWTTLDITGDDTVLETAQEVKP